MPTPILWDNDLTWDAPDLVWDGDVPEPPTQPNKLMAIDNRISITITAAQKQAIVDAVAALKAAVQPFLINLTSTERQTLPKISDATLPFHEKCTVYMAQHPELIPAFVDTAELAKDQAALETLVPCLKDLAPLCEGFEDTVCLLYSDVYLAELSFYASAKQAAKRDVVGADTIYNDLKARFPGRGPKAPGVFYPSVNQELSAHFLETIAQADPDSTPVVIQDQAGFHLRAGDARVPENVCLLALPPDSPELNPTKRVGDLLKDATGHRVFQTLDQMESTIEAELRPLWTDPQRVRQLVGDGWIRTQVNACSG